jgi:hypothetical protein
MTIPTGLAMLTIGIGQAGRAHPACSQIPLADRRWKLAFDRGFDGYADRIQNHVFSDTPRPGDLGFRRGRSVRGLD